MDIRPLTGNRIAVAAADPLVGVFDADGRAKWEHVPETLEFLGDRNFRISDDGSEVLFDGYAFGPGPTSTQRLLQFSVSGRQLSPKPNGNSSLNAPRTDGLNITEWNESYAPKLNGQALPLDTTEMSRGLAISATGDKFLLGAEYYLRLYDLRGKQIWKIDSPGAAWAVNLTADGRYAIAGFSDGTVRWYRTDNGQEVLGLFVDSDGKRWVAWTPGGFFDSSKGGETLIGYHSIAVPTTNANSSTWSRWSNCSTAPI